MNIGKEINVIKGLIRDGISINEVFDINEKINAYRATKTSVDIYYEKFNRAKKRINKGIDIEGNNFKKVLKKEGER